MTGRFGMDSSASDSCWDVLSLLGINDISNMKQNEVDNVVDNLMNFELIEEMIPFQVHIQDFVGCLLYFLRNKMQVYDADTLKYGIDCIDDMMGDIDYLSNWGDGEEKDERIKCLLIEKKDIQDAIDNAGILPFPREEEYIEQPQYDNEEDI